MAKAKRPRRTARTKTRPRAAARASSSRGKRTKVKASAKGSRGTKRKAAKPRKKAATSRRAAAKPRATARGREQVSTKRPQLDRVRRTLGDEVVPTPPSSLNMDRHGSAARSGRAELADSRRKRGSVSSGITGGDVDANYENAYFSGDEAPGGDNPTPDQDVVEDIGRALGVEYNDNEELKTGDKLNERDKHRWELDPASSEDYKDRD